MVGQYGKECWFGQVLGLTWCQIKLLISDLGSLFRALKIRNWPIETKIESKTRPDKDESPTQFYPQLDPGETKSYLGNKAVAWIQKG